MLYIYLLCSHSEQPKNICSNLNKSKHFHQRNRFISCEISFNKVKLPKVGSNAIVPVFVGGWAQQKMMPRGALKFQIAFWGLRPTSTKQKLMPRGALKFQIAFWGLRPTFTKQKMMPRGALKFQIAFWGLRPTFTKQKMMPRGALKFHIAFWGLRPISTKDR
jgi:hypothetical protein